MSSPKSCESNSHLPLSISALSWEIIAIQGRARASKMVLPHGSVLTPVFMPVGTHGTIKGLTTSQLLDLNEEIILANTYHISNSPGISLLEDIGGLHKFMNWSRNILTDSGGFQMVSLSQLMTINEEGVTFKSPYDGTITLLTPEKSIQIQNIIGADVIMALDDVVSSKVQCQRHEEAMYRTVRWLDRCISAHLNPKTQNLFAIVQGGTDLKLREICLDEMLLPERDHSIPGYAIGGLSGGEDKNLFWPIIKYCCERLPEHKPRYCMGVGYPLDILVCVALGVDMFDCVFPTRTARFGTALISSGELKLKQSFYADQANVLDLLCKCPVCAKWKMSRSYIHQLLIPAQSVGVSLLSIHNLWYMKQFLADIRDSIICQTFPHFINSFLNLHYPKGAPIWAIDAFHSVGINV